MFNQTTMKLNIDPLLLLALKEDITATDLATEAILSKSSLGEGSLIAKENGIVCGISIFKRVFQLVDGTVVFETFANDGDTINKGDLLMTIRGDMASILSAERTALNYLQRMSGIATYTHKVASLLKNSKTVLVDTRKTTPNNRIFEKYAVSIGGGKNHRYNLTTGVILKDNHIGAAGGLKEAISLARQSIPFLYKIEVETENLSMVKEALEAQVDVIMLDNMSFDEISNALELIDHKAEVEVSGNMTEERILELVNLGVDYISMGALTHSAPVLDFSLKNLHPINKS